MRSSARSPLARPASLPLGASRGLGWRFPFNPVWLLIAPIILTVVGLLVTVFWLSFQQGLPGTPEAHYTLDNYSSLYSDRFVLTALLNTAGMTATTVAVALFFGLAIAWLVERTDLTGKSAIYTLMTIGLLLPTFFVAMGWLFLLSPRIGVINYWIKSLTGLTQGPFDVQTVVGMGWVQGLSLAAPAFILTSASFRSMDPALEEAASAHGANFGQMLRRVFIPLVFPGILASGLYITTIAIATFDVPAILGLSNRVFTFSTFVYVVSTLRSESLPEYGPTAAMSVLMVAVAIALSYWYGRVIGKGSQYQVVTGRAYRPHRYALGRWALPAWLFVGAYFALSKALPLLMVAWAAGLPFFQPPSLQALSRMSLANFHDIPFDFLLRGASNTAVLMIAVPTLALAASFAFSWMVVRSRSRLRGLLDFFAFLPHAVPDIIFGVGALFLALFVLRGVPLYGSLILLLIVYVVVRVSFGTRLLNTALIQVHSELEEAASMSGASGMRVARSILVPLIAPALLNGWLWIALQTYRELTLATVLFSRDNITLSVVVWTLWQGGKDGAAAAITLLLLACLVPLALAYFVLGRRQISGSAGASVR